MQNNQLEISFSKTFISILSSKTNAVTKIPHEELETSEDKPLGKIDDVRLVLANQNLEWYFKKLAFDHPTIWLPRICTRTKFLRGSHGFFHPKRGLLLYVGQRNCPVSSRVGESYTFDRNIHTSNFKFQLDCPSITQESISLIAEEFDGHLPLVFSARGKPLLNAIYMTLLRLAFPHRVLVCKNLFETFESTKDNTEVRKYKVLSRALKFGIEARQQLSLHESSTEISTEDIRKFLDPDYMMRLASYLNHPTKILEPFLQSVAATNR